MIKRTEITVETRRRLVVREFKRPLTRWCDACVAEVRMITPTEAAAVADVSSRTIYRWIEDGKIHFSERLGVMLICESSLNANDRGRRLTSYEP